MGVLFFEVGVGGVLCGGWVDGIFGGVGWHRFSFSMFLRVLEEGKSGVRLDVWEAVFEVEILVCTCWFWVSAPDHDRTSAHGVLLRVESPRQ